MHNLSFDSILNVLQNFSVVKCLRRRKGLKEAVNGWKELEIDGQGCKGMKKADNLVERDGKD